MGLNNLFQKPLNFEHFLGFWTFWNLLSLYALYRQLSLVKKDLSGEGELITPIPEQEDDVYKTTIESLKPYLSSQSYRRTLEFSRDKLKYELANTFFFFMLRTLFLYNRHLVRLWKISGKLFTHKCKYSQMLVFSFLRVTLPNIFSLTSYYYFSFVIKKNHGLLDKTKLVFFKQSLSWIFLSSLSHFLFVSLFPKFSFFNRTHFCLMIFYYFKNTNFQTLLFLLLLSLLLFLFFTYFYFPLIYRPAHLLDPELSRGIESIASNVNFDTKDLKVIKSEDTVLPSISWGFWRFKRLYLNQKLLSYNEPQLIAYLTYSLSHFRYNHFLKVLLLYLLNSAALILSYNYFKNDKDIFRSFGTNTYNAFPLKFETFLYTYSPVFYFFKLARNIFLNFSGYQSDRHTVRLGHGKELAQFWIRLYRENKWLVNLDPLYGIFFFYRPVLFNRIYVIYDYISSN